MTSDLEETARANGDFPFPPAISVILPTCQRRDLVVRAISSVLEQAFRDFELIVVDDGSTDGTQAAVAGFGGKIRYVWQENRGVSAARNTGIRLARGRIIAFLDADDHWLPDHLAVVSEVFDRHPEAILCTTTPRFEIGGCEPASAAKVVDALPSLFAENIVGCPSSVAVRSEPLHSADGFDERLLVMEGWDLWLRLALLGKYALLQRRTIIVQTTEGSLSNRAARSGEYLRAIETMSTIVAGLAGRLDHRKDRALLLKRAAGLSTYLEALSALARDDRDCARVKLAAACVGLPELSLEPQLVANRLSLLRFGPEARLQSFGAAAALWPDTGADTALYLRFHALVLALRLGRASAAARLLSSWPVTATPGFIMRRASLFGRLLRRTLQKRLHRGRESSAMPEKNGRDGRRQCS